MKKKLLLFLLLVALTIAAQEKIDSTTGTIIFEASVPLFEPIKAENKNVYCVLNTKKSTVLFVVYINQFSFERSLMKEHFNNYYMESKKYPKATFKGVIEKFDVKNIKPEAVTYYIKGRMTLHGKSKNIRVPATIKKGVSGLEIVSNFIINSEDFNIEIPYIIRNKIARNVNVSLKSVL